VLQVAITLAAADIVEIAMRQIAKDNLKAIKEKGMFLP